MKDIKYIFEEGKKLNIEYTNADGDVAYIGDIVFAFSDKKLKREYPNFDPDDINFTYNIVCDIIKRTDLSAKEVANVLNMSKIGFTNWEPVDDDKKIAKIKCMSSEGEIHYLTIKKK